MQNPIGEADLEWIFARNCEGTEQLRVIMINHIDVEGNICLKKLKNNWYLDLTRNFEVKKPQPHDKNGIVVFNFNIENRTSMKI